MHSVLHSGIGAHDRYKHTYRSIVGRPWHYATVHRSNNYEIRCKSFTTGPRQSPAEAVAGQSVCGFSPL